MIIICDHTFQNHSSIITGLIYICCIYMHLSADWCPYYLLSPWLALANSNLGNTIINRQRTKSMQAQKRLRVSAFCMFLIPHLPSGFAVLTLHRHAHHLTHRRGPWWSIQHRFVFRHLGSSFLLKFQKYKIHKKI